MKLVNAIENPAILSNVGEVGEFRIRNSAKAFSILSSGLYANKIKAIIRELSCNAYDSHVEAGRADCPFDVHLPNALEPWFAIRDYGTGLDHAQVTQIYTTYFESTKTNSDDYVGQLGLGSKSPFSYTDNFSITAVKNGRRGVYTAFINEQGVPSIALMHEEESDDAPGVEIKFAVNEQWDFRKFQQEAEAVFKYFKLQPNVTGVANFEVDKVEYELTDIIPGVHSMTGYYRDSVAVMGNIAYPIQVPNAETNLGDELANMLRCKLELHFDIGELDIQASREGLSYIPQTIASIKRKLQTVADSLESKIESEVNQIDNEWDKALYLIKMANSPLTNAAALQYVANNPSALVAPGYRGLHSKAMLVNIDKLKEWNIALSGFSAQPGRVSCSPLRADAQETQADGTSIVAWDIEVGAHKAFVVQDTKVSAGNRAKYHFRHEDQLRREYYNVYVLAPLDKTQEMDTAAFFAAIHNPPQVLQASELMEQEKAVTVRNRNVHIMLLQKRVNNTYSYSMRDRDLVWREANTLDKFDDATVYYYIPLKGFQTVGKTVYSAAQIGDALKDTGLPAFNDIKIYGVRKADLDTVKEKTNWVNIEDFIIEQLNTTDGTIISQAAANMVDGSRMLRYNEDIVKHLNADSPYVKVVTALKDADKVSCNVVNLNRLVHIYKEFVNEDDNVVTRIKAKASEYEVAFERYPLLTDINHYAKAEHVAHYINLVDAASVKD